MGGWKSTGNLVYTEVNTIGQKRGDVEHAIIKGAKEKKRRCEECLYTIPSLESGNDDTEPDLSGGENNDGDGCDGNGIKDLYHDVDWNQNNCMYDLVPCEFIGASKRGISSLHLRNCLDYFGQNIVLFTIITKTNWYARAVDEDTKNIRGPC